MLGKTGFGELRCFFQF